MRKPGYIALAVLMAATIALTGCSNVTEAKGINSAGSAYRIHMQWKILHWKKVKTVVERYPAMPMDRRQKQL